MNASAAVDVQGLTFRYGQRVALNAVTFQVAVGEVFAFLGPNGGGKTTLFRVLSTLVPPPAGEVSLFGHSLRTDLAAARHVLGVAFQSPSLDRKLTVRENLEQQGALYGLHGATLRHRCDEVMSQLGVADRQRDFVEDLSGGLRRRVDLAKALLHHPRLLLLDEPSTGLDPGARSDLWQYVRNLRDELQMTIVLTTHLLDEADRADRIAILHEGQLVASGDPGQLRSDIGGDTITIETDTPQALCAAINAKWNCGAAVVDQDIRFASAATHGRWGELMQDFGDQIKSLKVGRPTLEDVFIQQTGHRFWQADAEPSAPPSRGKRRR
ncbi:MAG: ABC transporter ATP-binding protein [Planctomycetales bacterium]|nr:ABC transporter ATP-binding protein [Planctomycetales bacterium]